MSMPGAVPCSLGIGVAPAGKSACTSFRSGICAAAAGEQAADVLQRRLVAHQPDADRRGERFAREIVGRRAQARR